MAKIILGIHGLGNKPPPKILKKWWKQSIREGLKKIGSDRPFLRFDMIYWADIFHEMPLNPNEKDKNNELFIEEPYVFAQEDVGKKPHDLRKTILDFIEKQLDKIFLNDDLTVNYSFVTDMIIHHYFEELDVYFSPNEAHNHASALSVKDATDKRMEEALEKHNGKEILLISHSMGTIIAYNVLTQCSQETTIDTFVTMGSPLGLPAIIGKIAAEQTACSGKIHEVKTPEKVLGKWYNFSDIEDKISFNYNLGDDYKENSLKVHAQDFVVFNDFCVNGKANPHKSYGYLRTPELAEVIDTFLNRGRTRPAIWIINRINRLFAWIMSILSVKLANVKR